MCGLTRVLVSCGLVLGLAVLLAAGPVHAQGETRTIDVVPAEGRALDAPQAARDTPAPHPANVGNPQAKGPEQRVALVIGNGAYTGATPLTNPVNDAKQVAELLTAAGFEVISGTDLDHDDMIQAIQDFAGRIAKRGPNTVAFVYYAGHGLQVAGDNFLIPVDAKITREADVEPASIRLVDIMATLEAVPSRMRIVVLDACRNDPFDGLKDDGRGLAIVDAPNGSIVAYSTAPGTEAYDGSGRNSPYTAAFLRLARQPNVPIEQFFKRVRLLVNDTTDGRQTPWESSSLTGDFYFFGDTAIASTKAAPVKTAYAPQALRARPPREAYDYVIAEDSVEYYEEFIRLYPADPMLIRIRALLAAKIMSIAWYNALLANSPVAYQSFYSKYSNSPYAQAALKLQAQPKLKPLYQPSNIIVPAQIAPQVKLISLPAPQPKPLPALPADIVKQLDFSKPSNANANAKGPQIVLPKGQQAELPKGSAITLPPGKSLLDVKVPGKDSDRITTPSATVRPGEGKIVTLPPNDSKRPNGIDVRRPETVEKRPDVRINPDIRIVTLPNGGTVKVGPKLEDSGRRPPRVIDLPPRPAPQIQSGLRPQPQINPSQRFQPGARLHGDPAAAAQGPRGSGQVQFRGPTSKPVAQSGRRCAVIDGHMICR